MYEIMIETGFSASHQVKGYPGDCAQPHGHNWKVRVYVRADRTNSLGMVIDFRRLKEITCEFTEQLDHKSLNNLPPFDKENPTSENIAKWLYDNLKRKIDTEDYYLWAVEVFETETSRAFYSESE
ncbi:6-carboxytetrahydropterin synthase QueD [bacterium (candidate division B38) B3_B38]|nr:MAG: 6-carboxytetrahydropterin synthase QueD [bacterium (candidate division B38) B3_B38]